MLKGKGIVMIEVQFKRFNMKYEVDCESCGSEIIKQQPFFELYFNNTHRRLYICEDCGNHLQNDMSDEYSKFVDLGL